LQLLLLTGIYAILTAVSGSSAPVSNSLVLQTVSFAFPINLRTMGESGLSTWANIDNGCIVVVVAVVVVPLVCWRGR
jgi:hypothetical protein